MSQPAYIACHVMSCHAMCCVLLPPQGAASGAGFAFALAADVRIATKSSRFNAAFVKLGLTGMLGFPSFPCFPNDGALFFFPHPRTGLLLAPKTGSTLFFLPPQEQVMPFFLAQLQLVKPGAGRQCWTGQVTVGWTGMLG
jgi:hypothetical protein